MGDYRDDLQSALAQIEALRAENASLRAQQRAGAAPPIDEAASVDATAARPHDLGIGASAARGMAAVALAACVAGAALSVRASDRDVRGDDLSFRDAPVVEVAGASVSTPVALSVERPPVRSPLVRAPTPPPYDAEKTPTAIEAEATEVRAAGLRWGPRGYNEGLLVLSTTPEAQCSVGGMIFRTPRPVALHEGVHTVRCRAGDLQSEWRVRIEQHRVTFDTNHTMERWSF